MDSWPYDDRHANQEPSHKTKAVAKGQPSRGYPYLHQGMVGAVTLAEKNGRFQWSYLRTEESTKQWRSSEPFKVFPETRGPIPRKSPFGPKLSAQHGANFIRTCMPEADIPMELIREQLEEEDARMSQVEDFDPYLGNTLVSALHQTSVDTATGFLSFPMGDIMSDLNVSTVNISKKSGVAIRPVASYRRTFDTPIQQLVSGPLDQDFLLAVRTYAATDFVRLKKSQNQSTWEIESGPKFAVSDMNNREVVDIKLRFDRALVVNDLGSLYTIRPFGRMPEVARISDMPDMDLKDANFWKLAWDLDPNSGFVVSSDNVSTFDLRSSDTPRKHFELNSKADFLTSVEDCGADGIVRLCSTNSIIWLDRRNMRSPLLSVRHYRQFDRRLSTITLGKTCTFLTSRRNNLITVYDVSQTSDQLLHIRGEPYAVLSPFPFSECVGQTFIQSSFAAEDVHAIVFKLSDRGAISGCSISHAVQRELGVDVKYSSALKTMEGKTWEAKEGLMLEQDRTQLSMTLAYEKLFQKHFDGTEQREEEEASQVYDLVDAIPDYFQKSDTASEQMLTTYDVAFRAGDEPKDPSRSDFLTGSVLNSQRGYRALRQRRLDPGSLVSKVPWHFDLASTLKRLGLPDAGSLETEGGEPFSKYNLKDSDARTGPSLRLEKRSREQLEVDLRLSRNVFSSLPFAKVGEVDQTLETMTEALSLGDAPPDVEFGFLRPVINKREAGDGKEEESEKQGLEMGVKLLLKDWEVGSDLANYTYQDPYNTVEVRAPPRHPVPPSTVRVAPPQLLTKTQTQPMAGNRPSMLFSQPPAIAGRGGSPSLIQKSSSSIGKPSALGTQQQLRAESQKTAPAQVEYPQSQTQSQEGMISNTQVLPGPFGGRPSKKKPEKKKRMGGF